MRAEELIEKIQEQYPDSLLLIDKLTEKEKIEYIAVVKLIEFMKILVDPKTLKDK